MDFMLLLSAIALWTCASLTGSLHAHADASVSAPVKCGLGSFACSDGRECVPYDHVCDGEPDCADGSDEEACSEQCAEGQFQCAHGLKCIDQSEVCDGTAQCQDRSDEQNCWQPSESCAHRCDDNARCLPASFICDGEKDCLDGTDEAECENMKCRSSEFRCDSGKCVAMAARCNGQVDCKDGSDERGCAETLACPGQQLCPSDGKCLPATWVCDGESDCKDGADEKDCQVAEVTCGKYQWACSSGVQCVPASWRCDGEKDCNDYSDEEGCVPHSCPSHQFQCGTGECLDLALVCNKTSDCPDGSDEGEGCLTAMCSSPDSPQCTHNCYSTPQGPKCSCKVGFQLQADQMTCTDTDECQALDPVCSHTCQNTQGSYLCLCHLGYLLEPDGHTCKITGEPFLLASVQHELLLLDLRKSNLEVIPTGSETLVLWVDYDWKEQKVFWVNLDAESIKWTFLNKSDQGTVVKGISPDSIAMDWVGRNLYWIDGLRGQIHVIALDDTTQNSTILLDEDLDQPRFLALMPQKGMMFWSEIGSEPQIEQAGMDGSERRVLIRDGLSWPGSLAVDSLDSRIYWTDEKLRCIGSATLDGEDIRILQLMETPRPFSIAVLDDAIYWSDTEKRTVQAANKRTGKNRETLIKQTGQPFGLKIVHSLLQKDIPNPCAILQCSYLCVLALGPRGVCRCPSGQLLAEDGLTCLTPKDSPFILLLSPTSVTQLYMQSLHSGLGIKQWPDHRVLSLPGVNEATMLEYVHRTQELYLTDKGQSIVECFKLMEGMLVASDPAVQLQEGDAVAAFAVDWITLSLYWSGSQKPRLHVTSASGMYTTVLLDDLGTPGGIALHPPSGRLCFIDLGPPGHEGPAQVQCTYMDGRSRNLIWDKALKPISLTFSSDGDRLYWADSSVIGSVSIDGSGYLEFKTQGSSVKSLCIIDDVLFWTTLNDIVKVWYRKAEEPEQLWLVVESDVVAMKAYSEDLQKGTNECSVENGGCGHLCLPFPGGRTCRCAWGHLSINETDCVPVHQCPPNAKLCGDGNTCLPVAKFCDGHPDCPDGSDENCVEDRKKPLGPILVVPSTSLPVPSTTLVLPTPMDDALLRELDAQPCDEQLCGGHGKCVVMPGRGSVCECQPGFSGEFCQDRAGLSVQALLIFVGSAFAASVVVIGAIILVVRKRKQVNKRRGRALTKETTQTEMTTRAEQSSVHAPLNENPEESPSAE
ncbi:low-density lipoprotein receptor-related protein 2 [Scleropages formosus]|uniref:low-density lipoprotein receptor-related protein 2 n=1 Tax=Scleropages formosus TaxID=113540 RepID=UPI0010FA8D01|nr:low-density lipoprotein receptor-related protein 2-like [Scleropages formosus]